MIRWGKVTVSSELLSELLPGAVTVVFERTEDLNPDLNPGTSLVGIRIPDHKFVREISRSCQGPIALTSANVSSTQSTLNIQVRPGKKVGLILISIFSILYSLSK